TTFLVVVHRRQVVVDERERVDELDRQRRRHHLLGRRAERLADRERDNRTHALAADLERVAHRRRLAVQLRPEVEPLERLLDERFQLVRTVHPHPHPHPLRAVRASAPPRPPSPAPTARRAARSPARANRLLPPRAARARRAQPRPASAAPRPASTIRRCSKFPLSAPAKPAPPLS